MWEQKGRGIQPTLKNEQLRYFSLAQKYPQNAEHYLKRARQVWSTFTETFERVTGAKSAS